jgi:hypothetical protein
LPSRPNGHHRRRQALETGSADEEANVYIGLGTLILIIILILILT